MTGKDMGRVKKTLYFCSGGPCTQKGSGLLIRETRALLKTEGLYSSIHTIKTLCTSHCDHGPIIAVQPDNLWYERMDAEKSERVIREHILENRPVEAWFLDSGRPTTSAWMDVTPKLKSFEPRNLPEWGDVLAAVMDPWEINLHPLMKDLFMNRFQGLRFEAPGAVEGSFSLDEPADLKYDGIRADIETPTQRFSLAIGLFKETDPDYPRLWRDRITEVLFAQTQGREGTDLERILLATSRSGGRALIVRFPSPGSVAGPDPWEHYTKIYLERT